MKAILALGLVLGSAAIAAAESELSWSTDWPATFAQAKEEHRLVLVEVRSPSCVTCDAMDDRTWNDPVIADMLQPFLLLRIDAATSPKMGAYTIGSFRGIVIFDPAGQPRFRFAGYQAPDALARHLQRTGAAAKLILQASEMLEAGKPVDAQILVGQAYGAAEQTEASIAAFATAAAEAAARGDEKLQRTAEIYGALAWVRVNPDEGLKHLRAIAPSEDDEVEYIRQMAFVMLHMRRGDRKAATQAAKRAAKHCPDETKKQCEEMAKELADYRTSRPVVPSLVPPNPRRPEVTEKSLRP